MTTTMPTGDWSTTEPAVSYPSCHDDCRSGDLPCPHPDECQDGLGWYHAITAAILLVLIGAAIGASIAYLVGVGL